VKPNILIIVTDDQGYADLSAYAHAAADIQTPNLDRLARSGILFEQAYVTAPVCSPSRSGFNTGRYQQRWDGKAGWKSGLPETVKTIAEHLKPAGYVTGKLGKSDYGTDYHTHDARVYPLNHGFDEFLGFSSHAHDYYLLSEEVEAKTPDPHGHSAALGPLMHNETRKSYASGYLTEIFTDAATDFLERHQAEPFLLQLHYNSVHHLIHEVPKRYLDKFGVPEIPRYNPEDGGSYEDYYRTYNSLDPITDKDMRGYYLANLNCLDDNIGRLLDTLDRLGLAENTLIVCFGDNGGSPLTGADNRPLRGAKFDVYEGGLRVPFMLRWPAVLGAATCFKLPVSALDVLPTVLEAAQLERPAELDGCSLLPALRGEETEPLPSRALFWKWQESFAVREGPWKLMRGRTDPPNRAPTSRILDGPDAGHLSLFNLDKDPAEQQNLIAQHPDTAERLQKLYDAWDAENGAIPMSG